MRIRSKTFTAAVMAAFIFSSAYAVEPWSVRMVESEMRRNPTGAWIDFMEGILKWNYTTGLELMAFLDVYDRYGDDRIWEYALHYADTIINDQGEIYRYSMENFNIDHICPGRILFRIYDRTGEEKYRRTLDILRDQLYHQPRTSDGGFWHKKIYPWQMWLDGLYMGSPFYAQYALTYETGEQRQRSFEDIAHQFLTIAKHTYDPSTGLYRHAWDETRGMFWADPVTGQSKHIWGRALGWYAMGIVEVLDYMPVSTEGYNEMVELLRRIYDLLPRYADPVTGMWYQVLKLPGREGNYLESTCSAMFTYTMLKGVRRGYLESSHLERALEAYSNLISTFIREEVDGTISLTGCCAVAGLGGNDDRDGTFEYYISEPVRDNDPKGTGPFIWASLEYEWLTAQRK